MMEDEVLFSQYILEKNDYKICEMIKNNTKLFFRIPKDCRKEKHIITAIKKDNHIFSQLDDEEKTLKICEIAISTPHGYICFDYVPEIFKTEDFILRMIDKKGYIIEYIDNPTKEMCLRAVKSNPYSIYSINNPTEEMWHIAIEKGNGIIFSVINPTEKMMSLAVKTQGLYNSWRNMPQYYNAVLAYMKKHGNSLKHISRKLKTYEICKAAIQSGCKAIKFVNKATLKKHPDLLQLSIEKWGQ